MKTLALLLLFATPALAQTSSPLTKAKTVQVTITLAWPGGSPVIGIMNVKRAPDNLEHIDFFGAGMVPTATSVSDGKYIYTLNLRNNTYYKQPCSLSTLIWRPADNIVQKEAWPPVSNPQTTVLDSKPMRLYTFHPTNAMQQSLLSSRSVGYLWLDLQNGLPYCQTVTLLYKGIKQEMQHVTFSHWVLNAPLPLSTFQFTPPAGAKEVPTPK